MKPRRMKLASLALAGALAVGVTACSDDDDPVDELEDIGDETEQELEDIGDEIGDELDDVIDDDFDDDTDNDDEG